MKGRLKGSRRWMIAAACIVAAVAFVPTTEAADVAAEERLIRSQPSGILTTDSVEVAVPVRHRYVMGQGDRP
jgi:hypothetical protein